MQQDSIFIKGAKTHNLKNIDVEIPRNKLVVVTGVSGSGKSSLTMDTLFAEGQRRYVESLSSYARQFLSRMSKPEVDYIKGICPAIAIEQKVSTGTTRSTVGTMTEIYDYLRLLYARIGRTYSPKTGTEVRKDEVIDVINYINKLSKETRILITYPVLIESDFRKELESLLLKGFTRVYINQEIKKVEDILAEKTIKAKTCLVVVDRQVVEPSDEFDKRISDSVLTAFDESRGTCVIITVDSKKEQTFNNKFETDGIVFEQPSPHLFNFNNSYGACKRCEGFGTILDIDPELVIPDARLSLYEEAVAPWRGEKMKEWQQDFIKKSIKYDFPIHRAIEDLDVEHTQLLWLGNGDLQGIADFFKYVESNIYKIQYRVLLSRYKGKTTCPDCKGTRIRPDAQYVKIDEKHIGELLQIPIYKLAEFFKNIKLNEYDKQVSNRILLEIQNRLQFMLDVGLGYLSLNRFSNSLSGGETQRIHLTRTLGSNLTNSLYVLDEPSIGLHPKDTARLIHVLKQLCDLKNTVVVVEHEEEIMRASDYIIDVGREAGVHGGDIVFSGKFSDIHLAKNSLTADYLNGEKEIKVPKNIRKPVHFIELVGARQHNLRDIDIKIPLGAVTAVSGVSGSGKTTLIKKIFYPALKRHLEESGDKPGVYRELRGDLKKIKHVEIIDQNPLGRSSRSNPITYVKAYDYIRDLYADQPLSKLRGFKPKAFSFNVEGGRCESCKGDGVQVVQMQFLADVELVCEECKGHRFKEEVLEVKYKDKNIYELLEMTVEEAVLFFHENTKILEYIRPLKEVGLGYIKLGQSSSTLSGGEAQRVKLASYLVKGSTNNPILFIFDEPTTGLHFHDINKLLKAINQLVDMGHTAVIIEHNIDVIKTADWLIDLGPEGGDKGGELIYMGEPQGILSVKKSVTAPFLKGKFERKNK